MTRVKINFPSEKPLYSCNIPVRISDINYGNHVGNDAILSIIHEARMQMLAQWGFTELDAAGNSLIMGDVMIAYRGEAFYGDELNVQLYIEDLIGKSFGILYHISAKRGVQVLDIAHARTGMVVFDYKSRKITEMNETLKSHLQGLEF
jgi:acyl-CoA thioester hydrolase